MHHKRFLLTCGLLLVTGGFAGCGGSGGPQIASVHGTVTLDGQPLEDALIEYVPQQGRPANAHTDADGHYKLVYASSNEGAAVGKYTVKVTTGRVAVLSEGVEVQPAIPETLPAKYHSSSELVAEVVPGDNEFNFDLQSK